MINMERKVAIVTGGTKGIGFQIVVHLLKRRYFVYTNYAQDRIAAAKAQEAFSEISGDFRIYQADQSEKVAFYKFVEEIKQHEDFVHCIVCNTGCTIRKPAMQITDDDWEKVMQISVNSHFYLIRELFDRISLNSRIVFIGSKMGIVPHATSLPYGVTKSAIHALAKNLVKEFEGTGTTVNAIAPGFVETEWQKNKPNEIRENIYRKTANHRFATSEEIASAVDFCIDNGFLNGTILEIDGGYCYK